MRDDLSLHRGFERGADRSPYSGADMRGCDIQPVKIPAFVNVAETEQFPVLRGDYAEMRAERTIPLADSMSDGAQASNCSAV